MSLQLKWHLREAGRFLLAIPFMTTTFLMAIAAIRMLQFHEMGLSMYPGLEIPKRFELTWALDVFWNQSLAPLLPLLPITLVLDVFLRRRLLWIGQR